MRKRRSPRLAAPPGLKCPSCSSCEVARTHRKWWHRIWALFGLHVYRCKACGHRFTSQ